MELNENLDKFIQTFFEFLESEDKKYIGVKDKFIEWKCHKHAVVDKKEVENHCQYLFKKGNAKGTMCLKKIHGSGTLCSKHKEKNENEETVKCAFIITSKKEGKRCSKNIKDGQEYCSSHLKKVSNEEIDFTVDVPIIEELL
jgi:hypothetical protein